MTDDVKGDVKINVDEGLQPQPPSQKQQQEKEQKELHNGKSISRIEISENVKYLVSYSADDDSIVGWEITKDTKDKMDEENDEVEEKYKLDFKPEINYVGRVFQMCVSNDNILAFTYVNGDDDVKTGKQNYYLQLFTLLASKRSADSKFLFLVRIRNY